MFIVSVGLTSFCMLMFGIANLLEEYNTTAAPYVAFMFVLVGSCLTLHQRCLYCLKVIGYKGPDAKYLKFGLLILYLGVAAFVLTVIITSGFNDNIIFSLAGGHFKAERFWYLVYGIFFFPAVVMAIASLIASTKKKNYAIKGDCIYVAVYLLSAVLPSFYSSPIDLMSLFGAFFTLIYYTDSLRSKVTMDEMTRISNRTLIIKKLSASIGLENYYFFLINTDNFRNLNDVYGYAEGDAALVRVADTLKKVAPRNIIVGRIGAAEFAMLGELPSVESANALCEAVYESLKVQNGKEDTEWKVTVSIGYAECSNEELKTVPDILKAAEKSLRALKRSR